MSWVKNLCLLLRLTHWSKAGFVLIGVVYSHATGYWARALLASLAFCLVASAVYIYNDLHDLEEDKAHPTKGNRPLAHGDVSVMFAVTTLLICLLLGGGLGVFISYQLLGILGIYLLINVFYNHGVRSIPFVDVLCVSSGFFCVYWQER